MNLRHSYGSHIHAPSATTHIFTRVLGHVAVLLLIVGVAFSLRIYAINWGLPYTDHPDEPSAVNRVFGMLQRNDWNPRFFGKPSLYYYALRLVFATHLHLGTISGLYEGLSSLPPTTDLYVTTPEFFVWGRALTVVIGTATIGILYVLGRRWWNPMIGIIAAALLAVAPFHIRNSQYITQDVPMTLMALIALLASLTPLRKPAWQTYALAGVCIGLATSTKYNAAAVAVTLIVVHFQVWRYRSLREIWRLVLGGIFSLAAFAVGTPYSVLTPHEFFQGVTHQYVAYNPTGGSDLIRDWPFQEYLQFLWDTGLYPIPCIAALIGIGVVIRQRDQAGIALLVFILLYPLMFLPHQIHFFRNLLPIIPPLFIMSGIGIAATAHALIRLLRRTPPQHVGARTPTLFTTLACILTIMLLIVPTQQAISENKFHAHLHSKVRAGNYVKQLPQGAPFALALHPAQWAGKPFVTTTKDVAEHDAAWYRAQGFRYLIANVKDATPEAYTALRSAARVLQVFPGDLQGQPGPLLEALDLGQHLDQLAIERRDVDFGGLLRLLGFQRDVGELRGTFTPLTGTASIQPGQTLQLNLYWQPIVRMSRDYAIFLHLLNEADQPVAQRDTIIRATDYPTSRWIPGELAIDLADLPLPANLPPGSYRLVVGVYDMESGERLSVPGSANNSVQLLTFDLPMR